MTQTTRTEIPLLKGASNYDEWKFRIDSYLRTHKLCRICEGLEQKPKRLPVEDSSPPQQEGSSSGGTPGKDKEKVKEEEGSERSQQEGSSPVTPATTAGVKRLGEIPRQYGDEVRYKKARRSRSWYAAWGSSSLGRFLMRGSTSDEPTTSS